MSRSGAWLNYCFDRAMDAHTVDDALWWQSRIVEALSAIIEAVAGSDWPDQKKRDVLFRMMHVRARHNRYIANLETALQSDGDRSGSAMRTGEQHAEKLSRPNPSPH
jgi:hypothetical protein